MSIKEINGIQKQSVQKKKGKSRPTLFKALVPTDRYKGHLGLELRRYSLGLITTSTGAEREKPRETNFEL